MIGKKVFAFVLLVLTALLAVPLVSAQNNLTYGSVAIDNIDASKPFAFFNFVGNADDIVSIQLISFDSTFRPTLSLIGPTGQQLAFSSTDPTSFGNKARIDITLPQGGAYNIQVGALDGTTGQFLVRLDGISTAGALSAFVSADPFQIDFTENPLRVVRVAGSLSEAQTLSFSGGEVRFSVAIHAPDGRLLAISVSDPMGSASVNIPAGDGIFVVVLTNLDASPDPIMMSVSAGASASPPQALQPASPPQPAGPAPSVCTITTGDGGTNLRTGPSTSYSIITMLPGGTSYPATGQNGGWYTIDYQGQTGWLFGGVTTVAGPCSNLTFVQAPAPSGQPSAPTMMTTPTMSMPMVTSTATMEGMTGPTMAPPTMAPPTMAPPTMAPPTMAPPTMAPPTEVVAFPASATQQPQWVLQRDTAGNQPQTYSQTISAPGWHSLRIRVDGLSNQGGPNARRQFNFLVSCTSDNLRWSTGGPSGPFNNTCNGATAASFTRDSNQLMLQIQVYEGSPVTYTIFATRID